MKNEVKTIRYTTVNGIMVPELTDTMELIKDGGSTNVYYIELSGTSGTLNEKQKAILLSGEPTLNYINKDNMIFKCVFYGSTKAIYSIAGENKNHAIEINLSTGAWKMTTYELQEKLVSATNIKTINSQSLLGSGDIEIRTNSTTKQWVFKGEEIKYRTFQLGDHKKLLVKLVANGWMSFVDKPYWFVIDFDGIESLDTLFLLTSKTATDNNYINTGVDPSVQTGWFGVRTGDGASRQIYFSYHVSDKAFDWEVSHNDITWIIEFEFLD